MFLPQLLFLVMSLQEFLVLLNAGDALDLCRQ